MSCQTCESSAWDRGLFGHFISGRFGGTWPMELREKPTGPRWRYPQDDRPTQIPLGALKGANVSNLWTAGRCISCDHEAQAALRVIGTCLAAAWYVRQGAPPGAADVRAQIETILGPEEDRSG